MKPRHASPAPAGAVDKTARQLVPKALELAAVASGYPFVTIYIARRLRGGRELIAALAVCTELVANLRRERWRTSQHFSYRDGELRSDGSLFHPWNQWLHDYTVTTAQIVITDAREKASTRPRVVEIPSEPAGAHEVHG